MRLTHSDQTHSCIPAEAVVRDRFNKFSPVDFADVCEAKYNLARVFIYIHIHRHSTYTQDILTQR